jgi:hypothetical protein
MDLFTAAGLRDQGLAQVEINAGRWFGVAMQAILDDLPPDWTGTGEDLRLRLSPIVGQPHHHNTWGSLVMRALKNGLLVKTGKFTHMATKRSHKRMTQVLRRPD